MTIISGTIRWILAFAVLLILSNCALAAGVPPAQLFPWWVWPILIFIACFIIGIIAVPAGVGGGVLFVPIIGGFFPFHLDFVRGTGLLVALTSALVSSPSLLRYGFAELRLSLPLALVVSVSSIAGAFIGLALPESLAQTLLGFVILGIVMLMWRFKSVDSASPHQADPWVTALRITGVFHDMATGRTNEWTPRRLREGLATFLVIGLLAGMFGLGAGWANVPVLNLLMGVPLKAAAGTSGLILSMTSSAAWVYINKGAVLPIIAAPSIIGMTLGAAMGIRLLQILNAHIIRNLVIAILLFAGIRALLKGLGYWG